MVAFTWRRFRISSSRYCSRTAVSPGTTVGATGVVVSFAGADSADAATVGDAASPTAVVGDPLRSGPPVPQATATNDNRPASAPGGVRLNPPPPSRSPIGARRSTDRRRRYALAFSRPPQACIEHHLPVRFLDVS